MLPFDNKSEFQVIVDMPDGTTLEQTEAVTHLLAGGALGTPRLLTCRRIREQRRLTTSMAWCGIIICAAGSNVADIQVNLVGKKRTFPAEPRDREADAHAACADCGAVWGTD